MWGDPRAYWYDKTLHPTTLGWLFFSGLFAVVVWVRRLLYRCRIFKAQHFSTPVIVVGNITVGGTGKTPFVIWLAAYLQTLGFRPGIVSRGVGGKKQRLPRTVKQDDLPGDVGDEAILLKQRTQCPLVIAIDRVAAVQTLLQQTDCNVVISDDGLQHYRLGRCMEIALIDGERRLGNEYLLPAGPLREHRSRLAEVDFVVINGGSKTDAFTMMLQPYQLFSLQTQQKLPLNEFPQKKVHAIAGIGHPQRFFQTLQLAGFEIIPHIFPDHHLYVAEDIYFDDTHPVLMTEKDAVKCLHFADERHWCLTVNATINDNLERELLLFFQQANFKNE